MQHTVAHQIITLTSKGLNATQVGQILNLRATQVAVFKSNIVRGKYGSQKQEALARANRRNEIVSMIQAGKTNDEITAKTGASTNSIGAYRANLNR